MTQRDKITCISASKIIGLSADYIRKLCGKGRIKAEKLGNLWIMKLSALKNIKRQRVKKEPDNNGIDSSE